MPLLDRAVELTRTSSDLHLKGQLLCERAFQVTKSGRVAEGVRDLDAIIQQYSSQAQIAECLEYRAYAAQDEDDSALSVTYSQRALDAVREAGLTGTVEEANALGTLARSYYLQGRSDEADRYFRSAVHEYDELGMGSSHIAITIRNDWAVVFDSAGMPLESLKRYEDILNRLRTSNPGGSLPPYVVGNRGRALEDLGRFDDAWQAYSDASELANKLNYLPTQLYGLSGMASVEMQLNRLDAAASHLATVQRLLDASSIRATASPAIAQRIYLAQLELAKGHADKAAVLLTNVPDTSIALNYRINLTRVNIALAGHDGAEALQRAEAALKIAQAQQAGLEYSARTGSAWLAMARSYDTLGNADLRRQALKRAVLHFEHTVDADQPAFVESRKLLGEEARL